MHFLRNVALLFLSTSASSAELRGTRNLDQRCKNTAPFAGQDQGCDPSLPICVSQHGHEIAFMTEGFQCAACRNTQRGIQGDRFPDQGCPVGRPRCLMADGSQPIIYGSGQVCGGGDLCVNDAPYSGQDTNCPADKPICVDSLGREPPFHVGGAFCTPCVNTMQGKSKLLSDLGCPGDTPFCINFDKTEPNLSMSGHICARTHPSEDRIEQTAAPVARTAAPIATPTSSPIEPPTPSPAKPPPTIEFEKGLPCDIGLTFNPVNADYPQMIDSGDGDETCFLRMTPDAGAMMAASAFTTHDFDSGNMQRAFSMSLGYRIYGPNAGSADGIAFVMHQDPRGENALGGGGGYMGVYEGHGAEKGIYPALVIEFDTYPNPGELNDNGENNIHITTVSADGTVTEIAESTGIDIRTSNDGSTGKLWVEYCQDYKIRVFLNNRGDQKPTQALLEALVDLNTLFAGRTVTLGYTSAVGGQGDFHDITSWSFREQCSA